MARSALTFPESPPDDAPMLEWAQWHFENGQRAGYNVTAARPGERKAYLKGWTKQQFDSLAEIERHWAKHPDDNIALVPRPGFFWLDVDDPAAFDLLEDQHGAIPDGYAQRSPSGGWHILLKGDAGQATLVTDDGRKIGETRSPGKGQCVGAGSVAPSKTTGKLARYTVASTGEAPAAPHWIMALLPGARSRATIGDARSDFGEPTEWDEQAARELIAACERGELLKDYAGPWRDGERDNGLFKMCAEGKGRGIHPDVLLGVLSESDIDGGIGPDIVAQKIESAYHNGNTQDPFGYRMPGFNVVSLFADKAGKPAPDPVAWKRAHLPPAAAGDTEEKPAPPPGLFNGPEYAGRPQAEFIIPGVIEERGYSILSGRSQSGKSFVAEALAAAICTGKPWLEITPAKTGTVLYVAAEGQDRIWKDVCAWCAEHDVDPETLRDRLFIYDRAARLNTEDGHERLQAALDWIGHVTGSPPALAIFDTLRKNMRGGISNEDDVSAVLHAVGQLQELGIGVLLIAHHGRGHGETKGLTEWEDAADTVIIAAGRVRERNTQLEIKKQKSSADGWSIGVRFKSVGETLVAMKGDSSGRADDFLYARRVEIALGILETRDNVPITAGDLARATLDKEQPELSEDDPDAYAKESKSLEMRMRRDQYELKPYRDPSSVTKAGTAGAFIHPDRAGRAARPRRKQPT